MLYRCYRPPYPRAATLIRPVMVSRPGVIRLRTSVRDRCHGINVSSSYSDIHPPKLRPLAMGTDGLRRDRRTYLLLILPFYLPRLPTFSILSLHNIINIFHTFSILLLNIILLFVFWTSLHNYGIFGKEDLMINKGFNKSSLYGSSTSSLYPFFTQ